MDEDTKTTQPETTPEETTTPVDGYYGDDDLDTSMDDLDLSFLDEDEADTEE